MSNLSTLPIKNFVMQQHTAITKLTKNQAEKPGSSFSGKLILMFTLALSLFLVGSCNEKAEFYDFSSENKIPVSAMSRGEMVRHAYRIQASLLKTPDLISALSHEELQLALSEPDLNRQEGATRVWHYFGKQCVLDIYWVQKSAENLEQQYYEFRSRRGLFKNASYQDADLQNWQCLQSIIQDRRHKIEAGFNNFQTVFDLNAQRS